MSIKSIIVHAFLLCYAGSLTHSIVPHHHHKSAEELTEHDHKSENHEHNESHNNESNEQQGKSHFLEHSSNVDVLVSKVAVDPLKHKIKKCTETRYGDNLYQLITFSNEVFHPPASDRITYQVKFLFRALRAPPRFIA